MNQRTKDALRLALAAMVTGSQLDRLGDGVLWAVVVSVLVLTLVLPTER